MRQLEHCIGLFANAALSKSEPPLAGGISIAKGGIFWNSGVGDADLLDNLSKI